LWLGPVRPCDTLVAPHGGPRLAAPTPWGSEACGAYPMGVRGLRLLPHGGPGGTPRKHQNVMEREFFGASAAERGREA